MKNKYLKVFIIGIVLVMLVGTIGFVLAQEVKVGEGPSSFNFITWFKKTFGISTFSIVGDYRQCDRQPRETLYYNKGDLMDIKVSDYSSSKYGLINVFRGDWSTIGEWKDTFRATCATDKKCIVEVYSCPFDECTSNFQCRNWYGSGSECKTKNANDPNIVYQSGSTFNYCTEPDEEEVTCYYYQSGSSCSTRTYIGDTKCPATYMGYTLYSSKSACEATIPICLSGQNKCEGQTYYICSNSNWQSQGLVDGKCGYVSDGGTENGGNGDEGNGGIPINLGGVIYDIVYPTNVKPGESVKVEFTVKNKGDTGNYLLEVGIIPKSTAKEWGFKYARGAFSIFDWLTQKNTECCPNQPNIFAKTTNFKSGEIDTFKIKIPKAPYSEIRDLCYNNQYWNGTGEYVLYITMKTGCYPEGKEVTYETKIINVGEITENVTIENITKSFSLTKEEWDTATPQEVILSMCLVGSDCLPRENYSISCIFSGDVKKINENSVSAITQTEGGLKAVCFGLADSTIGKIVNFVFGTNIICSNSKITKNPELSGTCRAESKSNLDWFKWAAWFDVTGDGTKDGTDGLIIVIVLGALLLVILKR